MLRFLSFSPFPIISERLTGRHTHMWESHDPCDISSPLRAAGSVRVERWTLTHLTVVDTDQQREQHTEDQTQQDVALPVRHLQNIIIIITTIMSSKPAGVAHSSVHDVV